MESGMFSGGRTGHDRERGLYDKFDVTRLDGTDRPGQKHENCKYFVLDLSHDPYARDAIKAYIKACASDFPALAKDLKELLDRRNRR